eukprot:5119317-Amphidinium_carterae.1
MKCSPRALQPDHRAFALNALRMPFTSEVLSGQVPVVCRPRFAGANLVALTNPQGGHSPIAMGEVLGRSVST